MAEHNELGKAGEELAIGFLKGKGYKIREVNWFFQHLELDIIAEITDQIVVVEVKTRKSTYFGEPECFVSRKKQRGIIRAAHAYICLHNICKETRFDIITVVVNGKKHMIHHFEDAFSTTL